jgi:hypothetical protein
MTAGPDTFPRLLQEHARVRGNRCGVRKSEGGQRREVYGPPSGHSSLIGLRSNATQESHRNAEQRCRSNADNAIGLALNSA